MTKKSKKSFSLPKKETVDNQNIAAGLSPLFTAANTLRLFSKGSIGEVDTVEALKTVVKQVEEVYNDDMRGVESMLVAQASALNGIFTEMARRAAKNMDDYLPACETYMRMALKAQAQCRATLETLGEIKNPRVTTFVRQQNNTAQQQVNNNVCGSNNCSHGKNTNSPNELLSEVKNETLDSRRAETTSKLDSCLETVGVVDWA